MMFVLAGQSLYPSLKAPTCTVGLRLLNLARADGQVPGHGGQDVEGGSPEDEVLFGLGGDGRQLLAVHTAAHADGEEPDILLPRQCSLRHSVAAISRVAVRYHHSDL